MSHLPIDTARESEPIRLFKSDFLEFFTHISPVTIVVFWLPIALWFLFAGRVSSGTLALGFVLGLFLWTFAEYTLHRYLFHHQPKTPAQ